MVAITESVLRQSVICPIEAPSGHKGLPVTVTMPSNTRKPSLLSMVGDAIKQVQKDIEQDRAHLGYAEPVVNKAPRLQPPNTAYHPTPIPRGTAIPLERQAKLSTGQPPPYMPTAKTRPQYTPTPINPRDKVTDTGQPRKKQKHNLEYDPSAKLPKRDKSSRPKIAPERITLGTKASEKISKQENYGDDDVAHKKRTVHPDINDLELPEATFSEEEMDIPESVTAKSLTSESGNNADDKQKLISKGNTAKERRKQLDIDSDSTDIAKKTGRAEIMKVSKSSDDDSDIVLVSSYGHQEVSPNSIIVLDPDSSVALRGADHIDSNKHNRQAKESGKDSEKENKSISQSGHKSVRNEKDHHRSHKKHSSDKDKHHSDRDRHRSGKDRPRSHKDKQHSHKDKHDSHKDKEHSKYGHHRSSSSSSKSRHHSSSSHKQTSASGGTSSHSTHGHSSKHSSSRGHSKHQEKHSSSSRKGDCDRSSVSNSTEGSGRNKPVLAKKVSHVDLFGDDSDEELRSKAAIKKEEGDVDSDDVISVSSSTLEESEFLREVKISTFHSCTRLNVIFNIDA